MERREALRMLSAGTLAAGSGLWNTPANASTAVAQAAAATKGVAPIRIRDIKTILTAPNGIRLVVVKVHDERAGPLRPGLRHVHAARATSCRRPSSKYLKPFLIGRDVDEIEDIWQSSYVSSYWRNGPVLFNAMSGVDMALWDIKGKRASMPVYQLLGGKCRFAADLLLPRPSGRDFQEVEDERAQGAWRRATATSASRSRSPAWRPTAPAARTSRRAGRRAIGPTQPGDIWEPAPYVRTIPKLFEHLRSDARRRRRAAPRRPRADLAAARRCNLCKELEKYRLFFLEDPLSARGEGPLPAAPPAVEHAASRWASCSTRQQEYVPLIAERLIDFIRIHISQIGGLSMARKVAALCEFFGVQDGLARARRRSPVGARRAARARAGQLQLRHPRGRRLPARRRATSSPAAPR